MNSVLVTSLIATVCFLIVITDGASNLINDEPGAVVPMEGAPPGVIWVVQMSDIHLSKWTPSRGRALRKALTHALKVIQPAVVLVTGDLTDAKSKNMRTTQQEEVEWIDYRDSLVKIAEGSGIPLQKFFDLRGNHDKYGVPLRSPLDYYSKYSISADMNRTNLVQSVTVQGGDGRKHLFVGFDDSMKVGLRSPGNLFGHPTDEVLVDLDQNLRTWDGRGTPVTKIVYGHFPMSFTTSSETGKRVEDVMASNGVTAYVCGHLHTAFGRQLYKHHKEHKGAFWEWEMGDWRVSRMMRVMAIDQGYTSFVDTELIPPTDTAEAAFTMATIILPTYPLDSNFMQPQQPSPNPTKQSNSIRALVFSATTPTRVYATIYDMSSHTPKLLNSTLMEKNTPTNISQRPPHHNAHYYYTASWNWEGSHQHKKQGFRIVVQSGNGDVAYSEMRVVNSPPGGFRLTLLGFMVLGVKWERVFPFAVWGLMGVLVLPLLASWLYGWRLEKAGKYDEWVTSVFLPRGRLGRIIQWPFAGLVELRARNGWLWGLVLSYVFYLALFPWFSARVLAEGYPTGRLSLFGWTVKPSNVGDVKEVSGLGVPDIVVVVMSYLCGVAVPLVLVVAVLSAERTAHEVEQKVVGKCLRRTSVGYDGLQEDGVSEVVDLGHEGDSLISKSREDVRRGSLGGSLFRGKTRKGLFAGGLIIAYILWRLCMIIGMSYGYSALATAPVYAWSVPGLLVLSFYQTMNIRCRCTGCLKP